MRLANALKLLIVLCLALSWVVQSRANEPIFLEWLQPDDPGDMTIRAYWDEYAAGRLELIDYETKNFQRVAEKYVKKLLELRGQFSDKPTAVRRIDWRIRLVSPGTPLPPVPEFSGDEIPPDTPRIPGLAD